MATGFYKGSKSWNLASIFYPSYLRRVLDLKRSNILEIYNIHLERHDWPSFWLGHFVHLFANLYRGQNSEVRNLAQIRTLRLSISEVNQFQTVWNLKETCRVQTVFPCPPKTCCTSSLVPVSENWGFFAPPVGNWAGKMCWISLLAQQPCVDPEAKARVSGIVSEELDEQ